MASAGPGGAEPNTHWSLDFVSDQFAGERRICTLNFVNTKHSLGAIADEFLKTLIFGLDHSERRVTDYKTERPHPLLR